MINNTNYNFIKLFLKRMLTMKKKISISLFCILLFLSCTNITDTESPTFDNIPEIMPIAHFSFDEEMMTVYELDSAIKNNLNYRSSFINPTTYLPTPVSGTKLVQIITKTSNIRNATCDRRGVFFIGKWQSNTSNYDVKFILDDPNHDDLNKGKTDMFYYLINPSTFAVNSITDRMISGMIYNKTDDGWHCDRVSVNEMNVKGEWRYNTFYYSMWVKTGGGTVYPSYSNWERASDSTLWLEY